MSYANKKLSILADSISTFEGYNNDVNTNTTIGNNRVYYGGVDHSGSTYITDVNKTWWKMLVDELSMSICVNNSWSGSLVLDANKDACGYGKRSANLHNDITNTYPDVIFIYLGTNDANRLELEIGEYDKEEIDKFINSNKEPTNFAQAYALMLNNVKQNYKKAKIFAFALLPFRWISKESDDKYYDLMKKLINHFNLYIVDLHKDCNVELTLEYFAEGGFVHPNEKGMIAIKECVKNTLLMIQ